MTRFLNISTDNTLGGLSPSDEFVASQKAIKEYVDNNSSNVQIDDLTITQNDNDDIQAVGTINKNTAAGAQNPVYDWVGTYQEWVDQDVATSHPEWVCFITDDASEAQIMVTTREVGEIIYTTVPTTNAALHLADGTLLNGTGVYKSFYDHMVGVYDDGHTSIFCSEADWQTSNTNYGKCGKYVLDTTNHTIRLPKIPGFIEGTLTESEIGDRVAPGLPNITGDTFVYMRTLDPSGAFYNSNFNTGYNAAGTQWGGRDGLSFDASLSNSIYGNSLTVQPEAIKLYVYVVIANAETKPITVDINNIVEDLDKKANLSLDNSTAITNCITHIPQDIKLELNAGVLTLKAGSKVYVPNGSGVFDTVTIASDLTATSTSNEQNLVFLFNGGLGSMPRKQCFSGSSAPSAYQYMFWYDTTNNLVKFTSDSGSTWTANSNSLPLGLATASSSAMTSIDQIFNGFGYIGSTIFALPGVEGLIPYGRNVDGSLNNKSFTLTRPAIMTMSSWMTGRNNAPLTIFDNGNLGGMDIDYTYWGTVHKLSQVASSYHYYSCWFCLEDNKMHYFNGDAEESISSRAFIGTFNVDSNNKITSLTPKQVFNVLDYNDTEFVANQSMPSDKRTILTVGATGATYIAPADGYFVFRGQCNSTFGYFVMVVAEADRGQIVQMNTYSSGSWVCGTLPVSKGQIMSLGYSLNGSKVLSFVYANGTK